jgi:hypothetical protein
MPGRRSNQQPDPVHRQGGALRRVFIRDPVRTRMTRCQAVTYAYNLLISDIIFHEQILLPKLLPPFSNARRAECPIGRGTVRPSRRACGPSWQPAVSYTVGAERLGRAVNGVCNLLSFL